MKLTVLKVRIAIFTCVLVCIFTAATAFGIYAINTVEHNSTRHKLVQLLKDFQGITNRNYAIAHNHLKNGIDVELQNANEVFNSMMQLSSNLTNEEKQAIEKLALKHDIYSNHFLKPYLANSGILFGNLQHNFDAITDEVTRIIVFEENIVSQTQEKTFKIYFLVDLLVLFAITLSLFAGYFYLDFRLKKSSPYHNFYDAIFQLDNRHFVIFFSIPFTLFFTLLVLSELQINAFTKQDIKKQSIRVTNTIKNLVDNIFVPAYLMNDAMKNTQVDKKVFYEFGKMLLRNYPYIQEIHLAPAGIISDRITNVEQKADDKIIGLNLFNRHTQVMQAKETGLLTLTPPLDLIEGGKALISYLPVFIVSSTQKELKFEGITSMLFKFPDIFENKLFFDSSFLENYDYQIWQEIDNQKQFIYGNFQLENDENTQTFKIDLGSAKWNVSIAPKWHFFNQWFFMKVWFVLAISIGLTFIARRNIRLRSLQLYQTWMNEKVEILSQFCMIIELDKDGNMISVSNQYCHISGYSEEELIGKPFNYLHQNQEEGHNWTALRAVIWSIFCSDFICAKAKSGELFWLSASIMPIEQNPRSVEKFICILFDKTQVVKANNEKVLFERQLLQMQKMESIGQLASGIAHDFNNILTPILGFSRMALKALDQSNSEQAISCLKRVEKSALRAEELVDKMLIFSREKEAIPPELVNPLQIIQEVVELSKMLRAGVSKTIDIQIENLLPLKENTQILIAPTELSQILTNLIVNAKDAIAQNWENASDIWLNDGGIVTIKLQLQTLKAENHLTCSSCIEFLSGEYVVISVCDSGSGIAPEKLNKIFDPFFTTKEVGKGTGLGLSMVSGLLHNVKAHITVDSVLNEGTTFSLFFPVAQELTEKKALTTANVINNEISPAIDKKIKVFVVDDEEDNCTLYKVQLSQFGYEVFTSTSSVNAWHYFSTHIDEVDFLITDYGMPDMTGLDLAVSLLAIKPDLPIIICTGYSDKIKTVEDLPKGNTFLFKKPIDFDLMDKTIGNFIARQNHAN